MLTKVVQIGQIKIGGKNPIAVQSMTNTDTRSVAATTRQIRSLVTAGCEIVRVTIPDAAAAAAFARIRAQVPSVPLVADIHFDHRLALAAIAAGADKIRINPGNLGGADKLAQVVAACQKKKLPIRIGVNAGSLEKNLSAKSIANRLAQSAYRNVRAIEKFGYRNLVISAKASSVPVTVAAYEKIAQILPHYPLHLGVTEAGSLQTGSLKSAAALGALLLRGIGNTIRLSLTEQPEREVRIAWDLLRALELRKRGVNVIACPTCGRTEVDLIRLVKRVENAIAKIDKPLTIAVMGCIVNGPGEAKHADLALVGGKQRFALYARGQLVRTLPEEQALDELLRLVADF